MLCICIITGDKFVYCLPFNTAIQGFYCGRVEAREFNRMSIIRFAYEIVSGPISYEWFHDPRVMIQMRTG